MLVSNTAVGPSGSTGGETWAAVAGSSGSALVCVPSAGCCWLCWESEDAAVVPSEAGAGLVGAFVWPSICGGVACCATAAKLRGAIARRRMRRIGERNIDSYCNGSLPPPERNTTKDAASVTCFAPGVYSLCARLSLRNAWPLCGRVCLHVFGNCFYFTKDAH